MKKRLIKIIVFIILIMPCYVYADDISYEDAQKMVKESMQAWYMRGSYLQYNSAKKSYIQVYHPEDSTSQDMGYTVCSGYTNIVYQEAFGMMAEEKGTYDGIKIPTSSTTYVQQTEDYIKNHNCQTGVSSTGCNGEYGMYSTPEFGMYREVKLIYNKLVSIRSNGASDINSVIYSFACRYNPDYADHYAGKISGWVSNVQSEYGDFTSIDSYQKVYSK